MASAAREGLLVSVVYTAMGAVAFLLFNAYPVLLGNRAAKAQCLRLNASAAPCTAYVLPTEAWHPFDITHGWNYAYAYLYQMEWVFYAYINTTMLDCVYTGVMLHAAAHGRALAERYRGARDARQLKECVAYHQRLIDCVREVQGVAGPAALVQFIIGLGVICLALYNVSRVNDILLKGQFGSFFLTMAGEILLFCWYGEEITSSCEEVVRAVYDSPWPDADRSARRLLLTILTRSQRLLRLKTAGGYKVLSLETFLSLIQASYSLYTVLISMEE